MTERIAEFLDLGPAAMDNDRTRSLHAQIKPAGAEGGGR
jgi:hypothetical protein